jgi:hypothetical protein
MNKVFLAWTMVCNIIVTLVFIVIFIQEIGSEGEKTTWEKYKEQK